jgi:hypothetical protein
MSKIKHLLFDHKGFKFTGQVIVDLGGGRVESVSMNEFFIPKDHLSHTSIKRSVNNGHTECLGILSATVYVYSVYGDSYTQYNRKISLNKEQCQEAFINVKDKR